MNVHVQLKNMKLIIIFMFCIKNVLVLLNILLKLYIT